MKETNGRKPEINFYQGDCLEFMRGLPDKVFNAVVTSPPYNINLRIRDYKYCKRSKGEPFSNKYSDFSDDLSIEEYFDFSKRAINECMRVSNYVFWNIQMLTGNKLALFKLIGHFADNLKEVLIWDKINAGPAIKEGCLNSQFEFVFVFCDNKNDAMVRQFKGCGNFERGTISNVIAIGKNNGNKLNSENAAAMPMPLAKFLIRNFTAERDTVYDPFFGTATTAIACYELNRNFSGTELSKNMYQSGKRLFDRHINRWYSGMDTPIKDETDYSKIGMFANV